MVEYHAWAAIWLGENHTLDVFERMWDELRRRVDSISEGSGFGEVKPSNGNLHLVVTGKPNHRSAEIDDLFELWDFIAREVPEAHGLLYLWNDEDHEHENEFRVWVMQRGKIVERKDPFLSPVDLTMVR